MNVDNALRTLADYIGRHRLAESTRIIFAFCDRTQDHVGVQVHERIADLLTWHDTLDDPSVTAQTVGGDVHLFARGLIGEHKGVVTLVVAGTGGYQLRTNFTVTSKPTEIDTDHLRLLTLVETAGCPDPVGDIR